MERTCDECALSERNGRTLWCNLYEELVDEDDRCDEYTDEGPEDPYA